MLLSASHQKRRLVYDRTPRRIIDGFVVSISAKGDLLKNGSSLYRYWACLWAKRDSAELQGGRLQQAQCLRKLPLHVQA